MVFKFVILSDEVDNFVREILIESDATFLELNDAILESVGYGREQMTSFLICNDYWEIENEITLVEMDTSSEEDSLVMENVRIEEFVSEEGQKLMFVFDYMNERSFFMELNSIITNKSLDKAVCEVSRGNAPTQVLDGLFMEEKVSADKDFGLDGFGDFDFGDDFNEDELDNLSINDNYFDDQL
ncbi:MAG: hypothetical protein U0L67_05645 [Paludibacteraceae bacterium]|jgi:hypothetical protein|nr:hypothetical protein [Paludibacteraceae bacterium]MEE0911916.1 hypothetical protein [Paludibacteraceae bacterium]